MAVYDLRNFMILNVKVVDYRCHVLKPCGKNDAITLLNNSVRGNKRVL